MGVDADRAVGPARLSGAADRVGRHAEGIGLHTPFDILARGLRRRVHDPGVLEQLFSLLPRHCRGLRGRLRADSAPRIDCRSSPRARGACRRVGDHPDVCRRCGVGIRLGTPAVRIPPPVRRLDHVQRERAVVRLRPSDRATVGDVAARRRVSRAPAVPGAGDVDRLGGGALARPGTTPHRDPVRRACGDGHPAVTRPRAGCLVLSCTSVGPIPVARAHGAGHGRHARAGTPGCRRADGAQRARGSGPCASACAAPAARAHRHGRSGWCRRLRRGMGRPAAHGAGRRARPAGRSRRLPVAGAAAAGRGARAADSRMGDRADADVPVCDPVARPSHCERLQRIRIAAAGISRRRRVAAERSRSSGGRARSPARGRRALRARAPGRLCRSERWRRYRRGDPRTSEAGVGRISLGRCRRVSAGGR